MKKLTEIEKHKDAFLKYIESECKRSEKTLENYNRYLKRFLHFSKVKRAKDIDETVIDAYKKWLHKQVTHTGSTVGATKPLKNKTQNYHLTAVREFLKYMKNNNITSLDHKHVTLSKVESYQPELLTKDECARLLGVLNDTDIKGLRDKAIVLLLLSSDLRVSELCSLNRSIDFTKDTFFVVGKGETLREIPLSSESKKALQDYFGVRKDAEQALFVNNGKRFSHNHSLRLTPRSVQRIVTEYGNKAGIVKKVTPQILRLCEVKPTDIFKKKK